MSNTTRERPKVEIHSHKYYTPQGDYIKSHTSYVITYPDGTVEEPKNSDLNLIREMLMTKGYTHYDKFSIITIHRNEVKTIRKKPIFRVTLSTYDYI